jgi:hypothetical protein
MQMIRCLWAHSEPPQFCTMWASDLEAASFNDDFARPIDKLNEICLRYASVLSGLRENKISAANGIHAIDELDAAMAQWAIDTLRSDMRWRYSVFPLNHSNHVWKGIVHAYSGMPIPSVWNSYRSSRLMMLRTRERLRRSVVIPDVQRSQQQFDLRQIRQGLVDDICACIPVQLGHAEPAYSSACVLVSAYHSIWALFFAGQCALEWTRQQAEISSIGTMQTSQEHDHSNLEAKSQLDWIQGRFDFIASEVGLRWAAGVAALLREEGPKHGVLP